MAYKQDISGMTQVRFPGLSMSGLILWAASNSMLFLGCLIDDPVLGDTKGYLQKVPCVLDSPRMEVLSQNENPSMLHILICYK